MVGLTYSPTTGHVKADGAVVGIIEKKGSKYTFVRFKFSTVVACSATRLDLLLPKIRKLYDD